MVIRSYTTPKDSTLLAEQMLDNARADVFDYIERFYNTVRRHSTIG